MGFPAGLSTEAGISPKMGSADHAMHYHVYFKCQIEWRTTIILSAVSRFTLG